MNFMPLQENTDKGVIFTFNSLGLLYSNYHYATKSGVLTIRLHTAVGARKSTFSGFFPPRAWGT
jgi:hypothetical protein